MADQDGAGLQAVIVPGGIDEHCRQIATIQETLAINTYTITASNAAGSASFALDLEVVDPLLPIATFSLAAKALVTSTRRPARRSPASRRSSASFPSPSPLSPPT